MGGGEGVDASAIQVGEGEAGSSRARHAPLFLRPRSTSNAHPSCWVSTMSRAGALYVGAIANPSPPLGGEAS